MTDVARSSGAETSLPDDRGQGHGSSALDEQLEVEHPLQEAGLDQPATTGLAAIFGQKGFVNVLTRLDAARTDDSVPMTRIFSLARVTAV